MIAARFPRLYAAASLKRADPGEDTDLRHVFSAALCRGLIEACWGRRSRGRPSRFSAALCRGLIEAPRGWLHRGSSSRCFPRLYAAASLKRPLETDVRIGRGGFPRLYAAASLKQALHDEPMLIVTPFSAALCRGLIEASLSSLRSRVPIPVFRGSMPRPH